MVAPAIAGTPGLSVSSTVSSTATMNTTGHQARQQVNERGGAARPSWSCRSTGEADTRDIRTRSSSTKRDPSTPAPHVPRESYSAPLSGLFSAVEVVAGRPMLPGGAFSLNHETGGGGEAYTPPHSPWAVLDRFGVRGLSLGSRRGVPLVPSVLMASRGREKECACRCRGCHRSANLLQPLRVTEAVASSKILRDSRRAETGESSLRARV